MDLVVRTSHGEAEITLRPSQGTTRAGTTSDGTGLDETVLGDVVERVIGRAAPATLYVDGRATPSSRPLAASGVLDGSVVATDDPGEPGPAPHAVALEQIAGPGAGAGAVLSTGRHAVGPGRRVSTADLGRAPVDETFFEVDVDDHGAVALTVRRPPARLDGHTITVDHPVSWGDQVLDVGGRAFRIAVAEPRPARRRIDAPEGRSTMVFNRPPRPAPDVVRDDVEASVRPRRRVPFRPPSRDSYPEVALRARIADETRRRRAAQPDPALVLRRARRTDPRLWERRRTDTDALQVAVGLADLPWRPPTPATDEVTLPMVPVVVDLRHERGIGVVGDDDFTVALGCAVTTSLAVTTGPADLDVVVVAEPDRAHAWEWTKWLPHVRASGAPRMLTSEDDVIAWAAERRTSTDRTTLVVVDGPAWWRDRASPVRELFSDDSLRVVALADRIEEIPSICTTVVTRRLDDRVVVERPAERLRLDDVRPFLLSPGLALEAARALAPLEDPELTSTAEPARPGAIPLLDVLGLAEPTAPAITERWSQGRRVLRVGRSAEDVLSVDLLEDGPHVLVAGAPGSAAGALLRACVISLACQVGPDDLAVVLVDPDARLGELRRLPHVVAAAGDHRDVARVLRCLRAEVLQRHDADTDGPPPRLLVVVDAVDTLGTGPSIASSLATIAGRGPDVGVHLLLGSSTVGGALQRDLLSLIDTRLVLRLDVEADSTATIGTIDAALLPRSAPGRGIASVGRRSPVPFRAADADLLPDATPTDAPAGRAVGIRPFVVGRDLVPMEQRLLRPSAGPGSPEDDADDAGGTERLVRAIAAAAVGAGRAPHVHPVPDPLPDRLALREFFDRHPGDGVPFGLADLPDRQRQEPVWWWAGDPAGPPGGSRLAIGAPGSGTSSLLRTLLLGTAERSSPDDVHVYCIDTDDGGLAALGELPHVGAVALAHEPDRIAWMLHRLAAEVGRRGSRRPVDDPAIVLAIDDYGGLARALAERRDLDDAWVHLRTILAAGPERGCHALITAKRLHDVPAELVANVSETLVLDLDDATEYRDLGIAPIDVPARRAGRALRAGDGVEVQIVEPPPSLRAAVADLAAEPATERPPAGVAPMPGRITMDDLVRGAEAFDRTLRIPVGIDARSGEPATLDLTFGEHVFVSGPAGAGRSTVLDAIAAAAHRSGAPVTLFVAAPGGGPLADVDGDVIAGASAVDESAAAWVDRVLGATGPRLVIVDDADRIDGAPFDRLGAVDDPDVTVVVGGRNGDLRAADHWSRPLQRFRTGVLLRPTPSDGELLHVSVGVLPPADPRSGLLVADGAIVPLLVPLPTAAGTRESR